MFKQKAYAGTLVKTRSFKISHDTIERFGLAFGDNSYFAKNAHFPSSLVTHFGAFDEVLELLSIKPKQVLHSREKLTLLETPQKGDEFEVATIIHDLYEQQASGSPMGFVEVAVIGKSGSKILFSGERVLAIRGGFVRR